jgi:hypothetical protein
MNGSSIGVRMAPGLTALMRMPGELSGDYKSSDAKSAGNLHSLNCSCTKPSKYEAKSPRNVHDADNFTMTQDYSVDAGGKARRNHVVSARGRMQIAMPVGCWQHR